MEKQLIDRLLDERQLTCGLLDKIIVQRLLGRGLVYLDVPIKSDDYIFGFKSLILLNNNLI